LNVVSGSSAFDPKVVNIFMVEGGSLSLENISVRQESNHPEKHGVFVAAREYKLKALWICYVFGVNHGRGRTGI